MTIKHQADMMLAETGITNTLAEFGNVYLHGSYDLDLMVWHELDFGIDVPDQTYSTAHEIVAALSKSVYPTVSMVINQLDRQSLFPVIVDENALIDFRFLYGGIEWKLDIVVAAYSSERAVSKYNHKVQRSLTYDNQRYITKIKAELVGNRRYRKSRWDFTNPGEYFGSHDIYRAVFAFGVTSTMEFITYLKQYRGLEISLPNQELEKP